MLHYTEMTEESSIQSEIDALPKGTIVRRTIRGTDRFYHQWRENGVTRSRYLSPGEIMPLRAQLERRKYLLSLLAPRHTGTVPHNMMGTVPSNNAGSVPTRFRCDVLTGHRLTEYAAAANCSQKRDCFNFLARFIHASMGTDPQCMGTAPEIVGTVPHERPLFLVGPDGVGKTTLLRQLIAAMPPTHRAKAAYLRLTGTETPAEVTADLTLLRDLCFRCVFLDNAEHLKGLAGTGLTLILAGGTVPTALTGAVAPLDLSFIPFREHARLADTTDLALLVESGGTLGTVPGKMGTDPLATLGTVPVTALGTDPAGDVTSNALNDRFVLDILALASLRAKNEAKAHGEAFLGTDLQKLRNRFAEISGLTDETDETMRVALLDLPMHRRFVHAEARIAELLTDPILDRLGAAERKLVRDLLLGEMRLRLLEDALWNELRHTRTTDAVRVHRVPFAPGAYGFVIADEQELTCEVVALTTEAQRNPAHLRYLDDPVRLDVLEHRYGTITSREILYNGRDARLASGVSYRNLSKYLARLRFASPL